MVHITSWTDGSTLAGTLWGMSMLTHNTRTSSGKLPVKLLLFQARRPQTWLFWYKGVDFSDWSDEDALQYRLAPVQFSLRILLWDWFFSEIWSTISCWHTYLASTDGEYGSPLRGFSKKCCCRAIGRLESQPQVIACWLILSFNQANLWYRNTLSIF